MHDEPLRVILCDPFEELVRSWQKRFRDTPNVDVIHGDLLEQEADAYVSPANSFGRMDGGFDLILRERFDDIESRVEAALATRGGTLPVGKAIVVSTHDDEVPYLMIAPTMETPGDVSLSNNAYLAMRAVLRAVTRFNGIVKRRIGAVAIPGLCTGIGNMEPERAATQMHRAFARWRISLMDRN
jgi:O-acetyl-ADP-ribose deacetylase (regulator of RNase III)